MLCRWCPMLRLSAACRDRALGDPKTRALSANPGLSTEVVAGRRTGATFRGGPVLNWRRERLSLQLCMSVKGFARGMQTAAGFAMFLPQSRRAFWAFFHGRLRCIAPLSPSRGTPPHPWPTCARSQRTPVSCACLGGHALSPDRSRTSTRGRTRLPGGVVGTGRGQAELTR